MKRWILPVLAVLALALPVTAIAVPATGQAGPTLYGCVNTGTTGSENRELTHVYRNSAPTCPAGSFGVSWQGVPFPNPTPTSTSPTPTPTSTSPTPTPSPTSTGGACVSHLDGGGHACGPFDWTGWPGANGFNTYVTDQNVGASSNSAETLTATSPSAWTTTNNDVPYGYTGVQSFDNTNQLMNNWCGTTWDGCASPSDTPLSALSSLTVSYSETSPSDANSIYEFAPDVWNDSYGSDVMFWADTHGRCNEGSYGGTVLGTAVLDGQTWTVNRYGGPGAEIIFVLDSNPSVPDSCAEQSSGTIDVLAGFQWLVANGYMSNLGSLSQLNTGWEVTSADNTTFTVNSLAYNVTLEAAASRTTPHRDRDISRRLAR